MRAHGTGEPLPPSRGEGWDGGVEQHSRYPSLLGCWATRPRIPTSASVSFRPSPAIIDRLFKPIRETAGGRRKRRIRRKRASRQVPVRTFADWNAPPPGFLEIDLVAHCGGTLSGAFVHSFVATASLAALNRSFTAPAQPRNWAEGSQSQTQTSREQERHLQDDTRLPCQWASQLPHADL